MRANCNIGDVITIYRYEDKCTDHPSGVGVVVKVYDENRCFVRLLRNFSIPWYDCKPWKKMGIDDKDGYYVRREDRSSFLYSTLKITYQVSSASAYATKRLTRSDTPETSFKDLPHLPHGYVKKTPRQSTEVYLFDINDPSIPRFLMMKDLESGIIAVVTQNGYEESSTHMATRAYAKIQIKKWEKLANE